MSSKTLTGSPPGVAAVHRILQVERLGEFGQVVGIGVHVVAVPGLAGAAIPAAVVRDGAVSMRGEKDHLVFPCVGLQRPAMAENYGLTRAPVLVIDFGTVFGLNRRHSSLLVSGWGN